jgi:hypothetical protein
VLPGARGIGADDRRPAFSTPGLGRLVTVAVVTLVGAAVAVEAVAASSRAAFEFELMKFLLFMVGGGLVIAILLVFGSRARRRSTDDPFAGTAFSTDTINFAHVRVAGVGGAGLVLASVGVALQYSLTTVVLASGLVGGLALALILIRLRQRRA